ncbi:UDP-N-acetylglucosamine--N-acetylmuramyl-(pentapeptide) pyrophosphoryl-undecaprenol N-acetylglucosamine transferase [Nesterenkonia marinintestina]|uniref:UDP-N-acetylglucosamine--N-acetylmuramyl- (pentapeptide) pyrophosphoryl-undecaprenol N-acetylglucosamine transferase n=1 Tax=Nesterenkonia marinintestina TaxID=2979865 RepID=UPI0021C235F1|nr:UDP-N-acetylglucosamine--N-acetylmuramyl-(pentapeptide) pyrophosphoryl-undecaprenol N-acetylglucosamine transferase [Nesterenkonia sp. GX14115]
MSASKKTPAVRAVLAGGGTAGHVSPMIAVARALERISPDSRITMIGTEVGLETRLVPEAGFELETIEKVPMPRRPTKDALRFPGRFRGAIADAAEVLRRHEADVVLGVGGYVCTPVYLAAKRLGVPVLVHEANTRPGLANRIGNRGAVFTGVAFEGTPLKHSQWVGMPMSRDISQLDRRRDRAQAREDLGLDPDRTTLVVTGGSSGALSLNRALASSLDDVLESGAQVLHLSGRGKALEESPGTLLTREGYHQLEYLDGMHRAYAAADLLIARAGAATVCEVAAVSLPTVFVPLPVGNGEQELNARDLVDAGGALLVKDEHLSRDWIRRNVIPLLEDPALLADMQRQAGERGITDADERMAREMIRAVSSETLGSTS